jgi:hypothetical protein
MPSSAGPIPFVRRKASHVHPSLLPNLTANVFFPMTITIQKLTEAGNVNRTPTGGFVEPGIWEDMPNLVDIPSRRSVPQSAERQANEFSRDWGREDRNNYVVALNGYFPEIDASMRGVMSDGLIMDIRAAVVDSEFKMTTLTGRTVNPGTEGYG